MGAWRQNRFKCTAERSEFTSRQGMCFLSSYLSKFGANGAIFIKLDVAIGSYVTSSNMQFQGYVSEWTNCDDHC